VRAVLTETRGLVQLLAAADRTDRAALYRALGLRLQYEKEAPTGRELARARLELCGGGGSRPSCTLGPQTRHCCWSRDLHYAAAQALHYSMSALRR
jgi:hypothetical protein